MSTNPLVSLFGRLHGCPRGCPSCAWAAAQIGIPERLADWQEFVVSRDALRLVTLSDRSGRPLPQFTPDEVVQFCIEEALWERMAIVKSVSRYTEPGAEALQELAHPVEALDPAHAAHSEALSQAREFALAGAGARRP